MVNFILKKILGTKNERELKKLVPLVGRVNELEARVSPLSQEEMQARVKILKQEIANGRSLDDVMPEAFALTREAGKRALGMRHFDVQLIGGATLHSGKIAEMRTGEGKTLVATLPAVLNALSGRGVHVVTVNDYLARRDAEWMSRLYGYLGLTTGIIVSQERRDAVKQAAYACDITYGQNNEFGFDYLRDNMKFRLRDYVQRELNFAIVDEVDSILIDEARTPLIISGPAEGSTEAYYKINAVIPGLVRDRDFVVDEKHRSVSMTDEGIERVEGRLGIKNLYDPDQIETLHHVEQALRAHTLYKKDFQYVVKDGENGPEVLIVDEHTGRLMPGRRWSDGLHQAIEAKEGVRIQDENQTLATISFQNYFRMYTKLAGMTGTADTEAEEFGKIYNLDVMVIPTNRPMVRKDQDDTVYKTEREKFNAVAAEVEAAHKRGQPVLVGTVSIAKSEALGMLLKRRGVAHEVLNAKQHEREADIVAQAGAPGRVTIATNMAGRGTDILLGGNAEALAKHEVGAHPPARNLTPIDEAGNLESDEAYLARVQAWEEALAAATHKFEAQVAADKQKVRDAGGLHIVGTERHESRRIDNQLRGRAGRQGDTGSSRFFLSLEDDLMRIFASDRIAWLMDKMGVQDDEPIEHSMLTKAIANAQQRVEGQNFDIRKNMLEYDDVMNQQRKTIYALRRRVLAAGAGVPLVEFDEDPKTKKKTRNEVSVSWEDLRERVLDLFEDVVVETVEEVIGHRAEDYDPERLAALVKERFNVEMTFASPPPPRDELELQIYNRVEKNYLAKEELITKERFRPVEQWFFLKTIDDLWKDHLLQMDHLRQGIGLRGYAQKDPKQEYKKEGFNLFKILLGRISTSVAETLMRVELAPSQQQEAVVAEQRRKAEAALKQAQETRDPDEVAEKKPAAPPQPAMRAGPKVGRNDPCPCGSGKKYKKCHGAAEFESDAASP